MQERISKYLKEKKGEMYIDLAIGLLVLVVFVIALGTVFPVFVHKQNIDAAARQIARMAEVSGSTGDPVQELIDNSDFGLDTVEFDTTYYNASLKQIQFKTPFEVTVTKTIELELIRPMIGSPITIPINLSSTAHGISEQYWK